MGAVRCARFSEPPPFELELFWNCRRVGVLPESGGYLDQDAGLLNRMNYLSDVYRIVKRYQTEASEFSASERRFIRSLIDTGCYNG